MIRHSNGPDAAGHAKLLLGEYGPQLALEIARVNASACRDRYWASVLAEMYAKVALVSSNARAGADRH